MFHLYELLMFFMRPPKDEYAEEYLGPSFLHFRDKNYYRKDIVIRNRRGENLKCCFFVPFNHNENTPCVIYSHSISSSQLEVLDNLHILLNAECSVFSYDCAGCGLSDGLYTAVGWNDSQDLFLILNHLRNIEKVKHIALWGKGSGAVSSIIVAALDKNIKLLILDSPFVSLTALYKMLFHMNVRKKREIMFKNLCLNIARRKMIKHFNYDINKTCPIFFIDEINIPTIYIACQSDTFIHPAHILYLADTQKNTNKIIYIYEKSLYIHESNPFDSEMKSVITSALHSFASRTELQNVFASCDYSKSYNQYKEKFIYEYNLLDRLIKKRLKYKKEIIESVRQYVHFKYTSLSSISSSRCLQQSTMDTLGDAFPNENEFLTFGNVDFKEYDLYANEELDPKLNHVTYDNSVHIEKLSNADIEKETFEMRYHNKLNAFEETAEKKAENEMRLYKLMSMESAPSTSLKMKPRKYKKSLTWDSNLRRSVSFSKEDSPVELLKN